MKLLQIWTDGSCLGNPGPGGWAYCLRYKNHEHCASGSEMETTNNRMELYAAIAALQALKEPCDVELYTDSQYLKNGMESWIHRWQQTNWKSRGKAIKNIDLWKVLLMESHRHRIKWIWTKGHSTDPYNNKVDALAQQAARNLNT